MVLVKYIKLPGFAFGTTLNPLSANPTKWPNTLKQFLPKAN